MAEKELRNALIRLAHEHPETRGDLLPLLKVGTDGWNLVRSKKATVQPEPPQGVPPRDWLKVVLFMKEFLAAEHLISPGVQDRLYGRVTKMIMRLSGKESGDRFGELWNAARAIAEKQIRDTRFRYDQNNRSFIDNAGNKSKVPWYR